MRYQGRISDWKDDKGYGFVTPTAGGARVFVHIKSFSHRQRRPVGNELVSYELAADARGRPQAVNVAFVGDHAAAPAATAPGPGAAALVFAATFLAFVATMVVVGRLHFLVLFAYVAASGVAFLAYGFDKVASEAGHRRTRESTLHLFSLVGGWPGALLAQRTLRHKTRKRSFQVTFWATVMLNCAACAWLLSPAGMRAVKSLVDVALG